MEEIAGIKKYETVISCLIASFVCIDYTALYGHLN
jgi:hypothetical protein